MISEGSLFEATKVALTNEYDFIQARINADKILAEELQKEEREKFTIEQRANFLHDTIAAQRKFLAQQRSEAIRNKPHTRNQLRNQMMTYLKHVGGKKHSKLKTKTFEEIQVLYERLKRQDQNFVAIGSTEDERQIKEMNEESKDPEKKRLKKRVVTPRKFLMFLLVFFVYGILLFEVSVYWHGKFHFDLQPPRATLFKPHQAAFCAEWTDFVNVDGVAVIFELIRILAGHIHRFTSHAI
ncbi:hypothetical protein Tco_0115067 [Tanacetum coccineum]